MQTLRNEKNLGGVGANVVQQSKMVPAAALVGLQIVNEGCISITVLFFVLTSFAACLYHRRPGRKKEPHLDAVRRRRKVYSLRHMPLPRIKCECTLAVCVWDDKVLRTLHLHATQVVFGIADAKVAPRVVI